MVPNTAGQMRRRIVEISDELRALPCTAFKEKHRLNVEADHWRSRVAEILSDDLDGASSEWAERAGRKGSHAENIELAQARASIVSPLHAN